MKVLVIDDSPFVCKAITKGLGESDYDIIDFALNDQSGLQKYKELNPDIVALDSVMPLTDSIKTLEKILEIDDNAKILLMYPMRDEQLFEKAKSLGVTQFLRKPFTTEMLLDKLNKIKVMEVSFDN